jgi:hypothetical protein
MVAGFQRYSLLVIVFALALGLLARAETITIRMVDGNTGKPIKKKTVSVRFWWDDPSRPTGKRRVPLGFGGPPTGFNVYLDENGIGHADVPPNATLIEVTKGIKNGDKTQYGKPNRYSFCARKDERLLTPSEFWTYGKLLVPLEEVSSRGYVMPDECTQSLNVKASPGEYVVLAVEDHCGGFLGCDG